MIAPTVIEFGGDLPYLCELQALLRQHLAGLVALFDRDPGLWMPQQPICTRAAAVVNDITKASQPLARKRRLLKEAQTRFHERIATARPNGRRASAAWRQTRTLPCCLIAGHGFRISQTRCAAEPNPLPFSPQEMARSVLP